MFAACGARQNAQTLEGTARALFPRLLDHGTRRNVSRRASVRPRGPIRCSGMDSGWPLGAALRINHRNEEDDYRNDLNRMSSHYRFLRNTLLTCCPKPENSCDTPKRTSVE